MAPIRTAIIGLSARAATGWAAKAHLPYLLSPEGRARFEIVALSNSSVEAAQAAIQAFELPAGTRAYGSPDDLAADPDVQLVVCCTRVDNHFDTVRASVASGKDVYVEWPLAQNAARASELAALAREKGGRTVVGLQGWFAPAILTIKDLVRSGRIGKVLSSEVRAAGGLGDRSSLPPGLKYFSDRKVGGNIFTIGFGHLFDFVQSALGEIQDIQSQLQLQRPEVAVRDPVTKETVEVVQSNVPDLFFVTGRLSESESVVSGASLHFRYRRGQTFKGEAPFVWTINGEKGEIRLVAQGGPAIQAMGHEQHLDIEVYDFASDEVKSVPWKWGRDDGLPVIARNIGALYEAYASGDDSQHPTFEHGAKRHQQLDAMLEKFAAS